jgi:hypothetical protein
MVVFLSSPEIDFIPSGHELKILIHILGKKKLPEIFRKLIGKIWQDLFYNKSFSIYDIFLNSPQKI